MTIINHVCTHCSRVVGTETITDRLPTVRFNKPTLCNDCRELGEELDSLGFDRVHTFELCDSCTDVLVEGTVHSCLSHTPQVTA